jgi:cell wall-associated NlpC family hydrolase
MGHEVSILERANADWYRVKGWDGYLGFIHKEHVLPANPCWNTGYGALNKFAVSSNYAQATLEPYEVAQPIFDVSAGCLLGAGEVKAHDGVLYRTVYTPDMRQGYLQSASLIPTPPDHFVPADLIPWILKWMGTPYLWGGCSPRGFDCSGLVQLAGLLCNQRFPRDASQQVFLGKEIPSKDAKDLSPGDLLFFGEIPTKITHVAVYEGDGCYLHAAGRVRRNSLHPLDEDFEAYRFQTWQQTRRLV